MATVQTPAKPVTNNTGKVEAKAPKAPKTEAEKLAIEAGKKTAFKKVASRRVKTILKTISNLANTSNRATYSYDEKQLKTIFDAIDLALEKCKGKFDPATKEDKTFEVEL